MGAAVIPPPPRRKSAAYNAKEKLTEMEIQLKQHEIEHHKRMIAHHKRQLLKYFILAPTVFLISYLIGMALK